MDFFFFRCYFLEFISIKYIKSITTEHTSDFTAVSSAMAKLLLSIKREVHVKNFHRETF